MARLQRLATKEDDLVVVHTPINKEEVADREEQYLLLSDKQFATRYNHMLFLPIEFSWNGKKHQIQYNFCTNPYCKWCGTEQMKFDEVKGKPSRYRLSGSGRKKSIICNPDPVESGKGITLNCNSMAVSNWSVADEIARLTRINRTRDVEPDYNFHKDNCFNKTLTPFNELSAFYRQGVTKNNAQVWQCKTCKKKTSLVPNRRQSTTYNQKRNDILPLFAKLLVNKNSISRTCKILEIGVSTYYKKLEWLYQCCLEFLERHETKAFSNKSFREVFINTDKMQYNLNNVRKKGQAGKKYAGIEDNQVQTYVVVSADALSRYVFRADVAYDWEVTLEEIKHDTLLYKEDHLNNFSKKNNRLDFSYYPQEPSPYDNQSEIEYKSELNSFNRRTQYVDGLHVNSTYTTMAHYWLIKQMVQADEWRMISDNDSSIISAFFRVFSKEIRLTNAHHFINIVDKAKPSKKGLEEYEYGNSELLEWGHYKEYKTKNLYRLGFLFLKEQFKTHKFYKEMQVGGNTYKVHACNPIAHPLATRDKGFHEVDCTTDLSSLEPTDIAKMVINITDNSTSSFINQIRRSLSILERPIVTARGDGKSYIYANLNPKYAQYALTILRTYYNFCEPQKTSNSKKLTPAQRMGITDKQYTLKDIIYIR
ncbi:insertion element protein [Mesobacillus jeotgali]|uniref:insertion element protein n=1 Tax=Mesobacillus jeotgali TaxID=129985 RepID=UPI000C828142|nr:insertion element protein [Mesobacillus jeotgali]